MKILFVCATAGEAVFPGMKAGAPEGHTYRQAHSSHTIDVLITGVGMVATAFHLGRRLLQEQYDLAINVGICGSFSKPLVTKTVNIQQDCFADIGAEDKEEFLDIFQMGLIKKDEFPYENGFLVANAVLNYEVIERLPAVKGITVNRSSGRMETINKLKLKYNADIESMEGASFIYCCKLNNVPCMQIRSVSNYIEPRNKSAWRMEEALNSLRKVIEDLWMVL